MRFAYIILSETVIGHFSLNPILMKQQFQFIYRQMQADVDKCRQQSRTELERIECCFRTADDFWLRMRDALSNHAFRNEDEEIDFFKHVKPLFTSQIEFYTLIYQGMLFKPEADCTKIASFWESESGRLGRFCENKEAFIQYYKSGDTSLDRQYFLRDNNRQAPVYKIYDKNANFSTSHDGLVAALLAQEMYHEYTRAKLRELGREGDCLS